MPDPLLDVPPEGLVRIDTGARGYGHLNVTNAIAKADVAGQQLFDRLEASRNPLCVIQPVDAEHDASPTGLFANRRNPRAHVWIGGDRFKGGSIHPHREHPDFDFTAVDTNPVDVGLDAVHVQQRRQEVTHVSERVKPNQVGTEEALQHLAPVRQGTEHLRRRKGDVQKESDARVRQPTSEQAREQHQLIVMDPDRIVAAIFGRDDIGKCVVHVDVGVPTSRIRRYAIDQIVQQGPEHAIGESVITPVDLMARQMHRDDAARSQQVVDGAMLGDRKDVARPPDPQRVCTRVPRRQSGRQTAAARSDRDAGGRRTQCQRQPIRHDQHSLRSHEASDQSVVHRSRVTATDDSRLPCHAMKCVSRGRRTIRWRHPGCRCARGARTRDVPHRWTPFHGCNGWRVRRQRRDHDGRRSRRCLSFLSHRVRNTRTSRAQRVVGSRPSRSMRPHSPNTGAA